MLEEQVFSGLLINLMSNEMGKIIILVFEVKTIKSAKKKKMFYYNKKVCRESNFFGFDKCDSMLFCLNTKRFKCVAHSITVSVRHARRQNCYEYNTSTVFPYYYTWLIFSLFLQFFSALTDQTRIVTDFGILFWPIDICLVWNWFEIFIDAAWFRRVPINVGGRTLRFNIESGIRDEVWRR